MNHSLLIANPYTWNPSIQSISPYSTRMQENTDQEKLRIWTLFTQQAYLGHYQTSIMKRIIQKSNFQKTNIF